MSSNGCSRLVAVDVIAQEDVGERMQTHAQTHSFTEVLVRWCVVVVSVLRCLLFDEQNLENSLDRRFPVDARSWNSISLKHPSPSIQHSFSISSPK